MGHLIVFQSPVPSASGGLLESGGLESGGLESGGLVSGGLVSGRLEALGKPISDLASYTLEV